MIMVRYTSFSLLAEITKIAPSCESLYVNASPIPDEAPVIHITLYK